MLETLITLFFGYSLAVLVPVPWLSQFILDMWTKIWYKINKK